MIVKNNALAEYIRQFGFWVIFLSIIGDNSDEEKQNISSESSDLEDSGMERLRKFLAQKLKLIDSTDNGQDDESQQKALRELSLDGIVEYIKEHENCKIITMAGAGISTCEYTFTNLFHRTLVCNKFNHLLNGL